MVEVGLDHLPDRGAVFDVLAQKVPAGDVGDAEPLGQAFGLRSLTGARRADQQQAHLVTRVVGGYQVHPSTSKSLPVIWQHLLIKVNRIPALRANGSNTFLTAAHGLLMCP
jgi:hypothetical protein